MINIPQKLKSELWWLIISVDFDYSRICIADHELNGDILTLWLEDKQDYKNALDDCLQLDVHIKQFARIIKAENLNSYQGTRTHATKKFAFKARVTINEPIHWYQHDASPAEQQWAREALLKKIQTQLIENEVYAEREL